MMEALSYDDAMKCLNGLSASLNTVKHEPEIRETETEFKKACISYSHIRARWAYMDSEEKRNDDPSRTAEHNMLILQLNLLKKMLQASDADTSWFDILVPDGEDPYSPVYRKIIGDFACYVACTIGITQR